MSIELYETDSGEVYINNKRLYRDTNGNWIAAEELSPSEQTCFNDWIKSRP